MDFANLKTPDTADLRLAWMPRERRSPSRFDPIERSREASRRPPTAVTPAFSLSQLGQPGCWTHRRPSPVPLTFNYLPRTHQSQLCPFFFFFFRISFSLSPTSVPISPCGLGAGGGVSQALSGIIVSGNTNLIPGHPLSVLREFGSDAIGPAKFGGTEDDGELLRPRLKDTRIAARMPAFGSKQALAGR